MSYKSPPAEAAVESYPWMRMTEKRARERTPSLNILVAEDNTFSQTLIVRLLQKMGHSVKIANDGKEAVALYGNGAFDLIFMDIHMPKVDGKEATTSIRKLEQMLGTHIPVIAMTAHAKDGDRDSCFAAKMDHYMAKPVSLQGLESVIQIFFNPADILQRKQPGWHKYAMLARAGGDEKLLDKLMIVFSEEKLKLIAEIERGLREKKPELLEHAAHVLKEQLSYLGACEISETARRLEAMGRNRDMPRATHLAKLLQTQIAKLDPVFTGLPG